MSEILRAMAQVVARDGLTGTSIATVATAAGLQRTLVLHYFGNRRGLVQSFVTEAVAAYGDRMLSGTDSGPIQERVDRLFEPGAYRQREDLVIWAELVAHAGRDSAIRANLADLWTNRWFPEIERQLAEAYPHAAPADIGRVAYGLTCLVEAHWFFHLEGVDHAGRRQQAQHAAKALLATLD